MAGRGRHGQAGSRGRHGLAASEQRHDVAAQVLVVVVDVQLVAGALALAAGEAEVVAVVFLSTEGSHYTRVIQKEMILLPRSFLLLKGVSI